MSPAEQVDLRARVAIASEYHRFQWTRACAAEYAAAGRDRLAWRYKDESAQHRNTIRTLHWVRTGTLLPLLTAVAA